MDGALCLSTPKHNGKSGTVHKYSVQNLYNLKTMKTRGDNPVNLNLN